MKKADKIIKLKTWDKKYIAYMYWVPQLYTENPLGGYHKKVKDINQVPKGATFYECISIN